MTEAAGHRAGVEGVRLCCPRSAPSPAGGWLATSLTGWTGRPPQPRVGLVREAARVRVLEAGSTLPVLQEAEELPRPTVTWDAVRGSTSRKQSSHFPKSSGKGTGKASARDRRCSWGPTCDGLGACVRHPRHGQSRAPHSRAWGKDRICPPFSRSRV